MGLLQLLREKSSFFLDQQPELYNIISTFVYIYFVFPCKIYKILEDCIEYFHSVVISCLFSWNCSAYILEQVWHTMREIAENVKILVFTKYLKLHAL